MSPKIRVLIVDDSAFARLTITRQLEVDPEIEVIDVARNGVEALEKIEALKPNVVTLDVEMPLMDGLSALEQIMSVNPTPVIMLSSLTGEGAEATIKALEFGAVDFFLKPSLASPAGAKDAANELRAKTKVAARAKVSRLFTRAAPRPPRPKAPVATPPPADRVVIIGSSTGGPRALFQLMSALPAGIDAAILVVQHMPPGFTKTMAKRLDDISEVSVKEAEAGDVLRRGEALVAPGGYHMTVTGDRTVGLNQDPPVCGVRPSVDVTMLSAAGVFGAASLGVVLTGMGSDGTRGTSLIKASGGKVI
ncbi:MAG: chemotaxis response regulator protein-glutamate methylesterase, partial [Dehalococcoidia bacterium]